uniref:Doublecortin-like kinase 1a n=1 Tax=Oncorhynchus tshawytscha TaxID=74940 RepID=A0AAZ3RJS0_ONCTS
MREVQVNGNPTSHLSTPCSGKSPSPSPSSPATDFRPSRESQGSSISLASTKVCNSLAEGDGPVTESQPVVEDEIPVVPVSISERYRVGRTLGDGNFAVVRECVEHSTGREYALKIINKGRRRGKEQMIQNEVAILRRVKHPNIVLLIEEMDTYSELYLVMELVKDTASSGHCFLRTLLPQDSASSGHCFLRTLLPQDSASSGHCFLRTLLPQDTASSGLCFLRTLLPQDTASSGHCFLRTLLPQDTASSGHCFLRTLLPQDTASSGHCFTH